MSSLYPGRDSFVAIVPEVTYGTPVAPVTNFRPIINTSVERKPTYEDAPNMRNSSPSRMRRRSNLISEIVGGSFIQEGNYQAMGMFLEGLLGASGTSGAGPFVHTYDPAESPLKYTMEQVIAEANANASYEIFEGVMFNTGTIAWGAGGPMTVELGVIGQTATDRTGSGTASSFSVDTETDVIQARHAADLSFNGNTFCMRSGSVSINNNLEPRFCAGSPLTREPVGAFLDVTADFTIEVDDQIYADHLAQAQADAVVTFTFGAHIFKLTLHNAEVSDTNRPVSVPGLLEKTLTFKAHQGPAKLGVEIEVTNDEASATSNG